MELLRTAASWLGGNAPHVLGDRQVFELVAQPVAQFVALDSSPEQRCAAPSLRRRHRQGGVQRPSRALDVHGIDAYGSRAQLLVRTRRFREDKNAIASVND